ncbi:MAG: hypothetical protein H7Y86_03080 [Rhizobacter sp.]|nr:hypothetical protein [Ferruginibacter sp.]
MLNKQKFPALLLAAFFTMALFSCNDGEKTTNTYKKTAADSAAVSPMRDTSKIDTTADPRPLRPGN